jgi:hypothetical protein
MVEGERGYSTAKKEGERKLRRDESSREERSALANAFDFAREERKSDVLGSSNVLHGCHVTCYLFFANTLQAAGSQVSGLKIKEGSCTDIKPFTICVLPARFICILRSALAIPLVACAPPPLHLLRHARLPPDPPLSFPFILALLTDRLFLSWPTSHLS